MKATDKEAELDLEAIDAVVAAECAVWQGGLPASSASAQQQYVEKYEAALVKSVHRRRRALQGLCK